MNGWMWFWTIFLVISIAIFATMAVVVTIGGFRDMRTMLKRISDQHKAK